MTEALVVTVAVPTFHRVAQLRDLLPVLRQEADAANVSTGLRTEVLVVDNDPRGSARTTAAEAGTRYVVEPARGLAAVRNRAIAESKRSSALVFIDDDEVPVDGWLTRLVERWRATGAAAVSGRVESILPADPDPWIVAGGFFTRVAFADGAEQPAAPTNNLLLDLGFVRGHDLAFDEAFGLSGGEDIHFTRRLVALGGSIVSAPDAVVHDPVSPGRLTRRWVLQRAYRVGISSARVDAAVATGFFGRLRSRTVSVVKGLVRVVAGGARWVLGAITRSDRHSARGARAVARGSGMMLGAAGVDFAEYARR
jgi:succinoglycan biosynthesis protein ExoM